jgi:hypothetical protein
MSGPIVAAPGERVIDGKVVYSAAFLDDAMSALKRARIAWAARAEQLELPHWWANYDRREERVA